MRMIRKFNEGVSQQDIEDVLIQELDDESIQYEISKGYFSESSLKKGIVGNHWGILFKEPMDPSDRFSYVVSIEFYQNMESIDASNKWIYTDNRNIFGSISNIQKYFDTKFYITNRFIRLIIHTDDMIEVEKNDLKEIMMKIRTKSLKSKTDFSNDLTVQYHEKSNTIIIDCWKPSFTDLKMKRFLKGIVDDKKYNIKKTEKGNDIIIEISEK